MLRWLWIFAFPLTIFGQTEISAKLLTSDRPEIFDKVEIGLQISNALSIQIKNFHEGTNRGGTINPYDHQQISVWAEFISPKGDTIRRNGFFYLGYDRDLVNDKWKTAKIDYPFRVRFSPNQKGIWKYSIHHSVRNESNIYKSGEMSFNCGDGKKKGPLTIRPNATELSYVSSGEKFTSIGLNIASSTRSKITPSKSLIHLKWFDQLANSGGNFARLEVGGQSFLPDWQHIESYFEQMPTLWELDQIFETCENKGIYLLLFRHHIELESRESWAKIRLEENPYFRELTLTKSIEYFQDSIAISYQNRMHRYFEARYGYSTSWAFYGYSELDNALATTAKEEEISVGKAISKIFKPWYINQQRFFQDSIGNSQLMYICSYASIPDVEYKHNGVFDCSDAIAFHKYADGPEMNSDSRWGRVAYVEKLRKAYPNKPIIAEEVGLIAKPDLIKLYCCSNRTFHNTVWSTLMMDVTGTGMHWWWDLGIFDQGYQESYLPISKFIKYQPKSIFYDSYATKDVEAFFQMGKTGDSAIGWVNNKTYHWSYEMNTDSCLNELLTNGFLKDHCTMETGIELAQEKGNPGSFMEVVKKHNSEGKSPRELTSKDQIKIKHLRASKPFNKKHYQVQWYQVSEGNLTLVVQQKLKSNCFGKLKLYFPNSDGQLKQGSDYAVRFKLID
jgi:hypothetical protein